MTRKLAVIDASVFCFLIGLVFSPLIFGGNAVGGGGMYVLYNVYVWMFVIGLMALAVIRVSVSGIVYIPKYALGMTLSLVAVFGLSLLIGVVDEGFWLGRVIAMLLALCCIFAVIQSLAGLSRIYVLFFLLVAFSFFCAMSDLFDYLFNTRGADIRAGGVVFKQPNLNATAISVGVASATLILMRRHPFRPIAFFHLFMFLVVFLGGAAVTASGSRTGLIGMFLAVLGLLFFNRVGSSNKIRLLVFLTLLAAVVLGVFIGNGFELMYGKFSRLESGSDSRLVLYKLVFEMILEKPWMGYGYGSFEREFANYLANSNLSREMAGVSLIDLGVAPMTHPHNELMYWLFEGGVTGVLPLLFFWGFVIKSLSIRAEINVASCLSVSLPLLFHSMTELPFYMSAWHLIVLGFILACGMSQGAKKVVWNSGWASRTAVSNLVLVVACFSIVLLFKTTRSLEGLAQYIFSESKEIARLQPASNNFFYADYSGLLIKRHMLYDDIGSGRDDFVPTFIDAGKGYLERHTNPILINDLAAAYRYLGEDHLSSSMVGWGRRIYPSYVFLNEVE